MADRRRKSVTVAPKASSFWARLNDRQLLLILLGINLILSILVFDPKLATGGDNATYLILAQSILKGMYRDIYLPGAPAHTLYPPGFPALLAPIVAISGGSLLPPKLLILALSLGVVFFSFLILRRAMSGRSWFMPTLMVATCPLLLQYSHETFSEMPFLFFSLATIWLFEVALSARRMRLAHFAIAAVMLGATYYIRSQGLFLILAFGLVLLARKQWRELAVVAVVVGAIALPWFVRTQRVAHGGYLPWLLTKDPYNIEAGKLTAADMLKRFVDNLILYTFRVNPLVILPVVGERANRLVLGALGVLSTLLILGGLAFESVKRRLGAIEWYTIFTLGGVLLWPSVWSGDRFLIPIVPMMFYYLIQGLIGIGRYFRTGRLAFAAAFVIVLCFGITTVGRAATNLRDLSGYLKGDEFSGYEDGWRTYFTAAVWLRDHTPPEAVIVSRKPQFTYLYSGRKSFIYPFTADEAKVLKSIEEQGATHAFLETFFGSSTSYLYPVIKDHPELFEQVGSVGKGNLRVVIFEVRR